MVALMFGERTLAACWSPHPAATNFVGLATISDCWADVKVRDRKMRSSALRMSALPRGAFTGLVTWQSLRTNEEQPCGLRDR
jgi:hypothetical protein